jgi:hypothetical protein
MRRSWIGLAGVLLLFTCICMGVLPIWLIEVPFRLATGWVAHLRGVVPKVEVNGPGVGLFLIALPMTALLAHSCAKWLWSGMGPSRPQWRWKWTLMGLTVLVLMFAAGIGATGVVHQTAWLVTSKEPLTQSSSRILAYKVKCRVNLQQIYQSLAHYAHENSDYRPTDQVDFIRVLAATDLSSSVLVCQSTNDEPAPGRRPSDWAPLVLVPDKYGTTHLSYVYCPTPIPGPEGGRSVVLYEPLDNHDGSGLNLAYEDGTVEWIDGDRAERWLGSMETPTTTPAQ